MHFNKRSVKQKKITDNIFLVLLLMFASVFPVCAEEVIYPRPESGSDARASYPLAVLTLCEKKSGNAITLKPSELQTQQGRNVRQIFLEQGLDVMWAVADDERERLLTRIAVPIDRGLIGWRLLLIRQDNASQFDAITTRDELATLKAVQGHDWPDVTVLRANHFAVDTGTTYDGLFHMLARGHVQYFPRAVSEIWSEIEAHQQYDFIAQKTLAVHYPQGLYFFVSKNNDALAELLTGCLKEATIDGSLRTLFYSYYRDDIARADLAHRTVIELSNPLLHEDPILATKSYWFSPSEIVR